jgi:RNA polymerase sigma factor (TIGR02999 family)
MANPDLTELLESHRAGDPAALDRIVARVYPVLKDLARRQLRGAGGATLNTTGVLHEAFLRFVERKDCVWENRDHFYATAARIMRQVVVDHFRSGSAVKRGGAAAPLPLEEARVAAPGVLERTLLVDELLTHLAEIDPRLVQIVEYRYFAGFTEVETAQILGVTSRTVQRDWRRARAWLQELLEERPP